MRQALYRKWRSAKFFEIVGQEPVVAALKNQIATGRCGHAYIFTGIRGTGKTSLARILAKAVNCENPADGEPCGVCGSCMGIDNGSILDVTEIDAASNNGVDNIRDLRDETAYTPTVCKMRVYIIDEVHMLSSGAFNALLKILEEPPEHVMFILATTEIHKVPATILSRCQRFDLKRISVSDIAKRLDFIAGEEKISLEPEASMLIARLADGAMRDALSILDTCASLGENIDEETVTRLAGVTDKSYLFTLAAAIKDGDLKLLLELLSKLYESSVDPTRLCIELVGHYRNLLMCKYGADSALCDCSEQTVKRYIVVSGEYDSNELLALLATLGKTADGLSASPDRMLTLQLCFINLCNKKAGFQGDEHENKSISEPHREKTAPPQPKSNEDGENRKPQPLQARAAAADAEILENWDNVIAALKEKSGMLYGFLSGSHAYKTATHILIDANELFMNYMHNNDSASLILKAAIFQVTGLGMPIGPYKRKAETEICDEAADELEDLLKRANKNKVEVDIK
ncbi:MAG: DNA polymerase III subunit gamma/tau [Oscillospiraceae bacterium]